MLNLPLSPVSFNQSTQQVESFLRKVEELQATNHTSNGWLIKRHNIGTGHRKESAGPADKPLPRGLDYAATDRLWYWHLSSRLPQRSGILSKVFLQLRQTWPFPWLQLTFFFPFLSWKKEVLHSVELSTVVVFPPLIQHLFIIYSFPTATATCLTQPFLSPPHTAANLSFFLKAHSCQKLWHWQICYSLCFIITACLPFLFCGIPARLCSQQ